MRGEPDHWHAGGSGLDPATGPWAPYTGRAGSGPAPAPLPAPPPAPFPSPPCTRAGQQPPQSPGGLHSCSRWASSLPLLAPLPPPFPGLAPGYFQSPSAQPGGGQRSPSEGRPSEPWAGGGTEGSENQGKLTPGPHPPQPGRQVTAWLLWCLEPADLPSVAAGEGRGLRGLWPSAETCSQI